MYQRYDVIFAGAGLSGLSMATQLAPLMPELQFCLLDRSAKDQNDRTWCFWADERERAYMPPVIYRTWENCRFFSPIHSELLKTGGYSYNMVRGIDFYTWAKETLGKLSNITWIQADIQALDPEKGVVTTNVGTFEADWVLNSAFTAFPLVPNVGKDAFVPPFTEKKQSVPQGYSYLLQHFKGWVIRTPKPVFDTETVTMMDFRVPQDKDTRFVYVLPFSEREALVEFTVFSSEILEESEYLAELHRYIRDFLNITEFEVIEEEYGIIPMTDFPFSPVQQGKMIHIGTAGGFVKASSGYAFKRTQRRAHAFASAWARTGKPDARLLRSGKRFRVYDSVFLRALSDRLLPAHSVFGHFFKNLGGRAVFRFLDEDSNLFEDLRALNAVPTWPFAKAAFRQRVRLFKV